MFKEHNQLNMKDKNDRRIKKRISKKTKWIDHTKASWVEKINSGPSRITLKKLAKKIKINIPFKK